MMKRLALVGLLFSGLLSTAQEASSTFEKYPVFPECQEVQLAQLESCFRYNLQRAIFDNFQTPDIVGQENYNGTLSILFEVNKQGIFKVLYVDAFYDELKEEVERVFGMLPAITPATYNGAPTYMQFTLPLQIPLIEPVPEEVVMDPTATLEDPSSEFDSQEKLPYANEEYTSQLNIPLSHHNYYLFDAAMNKVGTNNHTAQKPYTYAEVNRYYNFEENNQKILKNRTSWWGRKWWNEHMVTWKGKDFWVTLDPGVDLQVGRDTGGEVDTYNNTRLIYTQGGIGKQFSFFAVIYESQGRFADYFNRYAEARAPDGGNPAVIPGRGIAKAFKSDSYDYPVATGYVSFTPSKYFNFQLGHGKNFFGDGYRSLFLSDNASPYPFFKINTTFWKLKYTNTWMSLRDVRPAVTEDGSFRTKWMAHHYLSMNITKRWNLGLFESVIWENDNNRGFDFNYLNPVIFLRAIEFSTGSRGGNALIGISSKYKINDRVNIYGQWLIDEFSSGDFFGGEGSYKNKQSYQIGLKYYDAFGLKGLYLQGEYNRVRPYTYSHNTIVLNYGHTNQSMAHTLDANFWEALAIARYQNGRWFGDAKFIFAKRGFEFNTPEDSFYYGGNIYGTEDNRVSDTGNDVAQGNTTDFFHTELTAGYLINPATNLKVYGTLIYRDFQPEVDTADVFANSTTWFNLGVRTDLFNWYYDF